MKTNIHLVDSVYNLVNTPEVKHVVSDIFKHKMPVNHRKACLVIVSLPVSGSALQEAVVNLNIYLPNQKLKIDGMSDNTQPDAKGFKMITDVVLPLVEAAFIDDCDIEVQSMSLLEEPDISAHFLNIRLSINSPNI